MKQGTIAERATAFRQQCELAETVKLKEIDLYGFPTNSIFSLVITFLKLVDPLVFKRFFFILKYLCAHEYEDIKVVKMIIYLQE